MADPSPLTDAISLIQLYQEQYTQTDKLWNYFSTVSLAVLAFTIGSEKATKSFKEVLVIILGYWAFCVGNFIALDKAQTQLGAFASHAMIKAKEAGISLESLTPLATDSIKIYYGLVVLSITFGVAITAWKKHT